ncbi:hypothetical protein [Flavobacterium chungangensis]|uniref:HNH domain-containing protein n=1 Tax=Flavobacterium chungangensis TaxID=2708132 RepID=A0ABV8ZIU3_9FLAO
MIYINPLDSNIVLARENHFMKIKCFINKKIGGTNCTDSSCNICKSQIVPLQKINFRIKNFLIDPLNLELLLTSSPENLYDLNIYFWKEIFPLFNFDDLLVYFNRKNISKNSRSPYKPFSEILINYYLKDLNRIINYDWFIDKNNKYYSAYDLSNNLDRNTCTYCNRVYTSTIINRHGKKVIRPTLDHWFPQSDFPLLALSFYNLIPSCSSCNSSIKGATNFNLNDHIHPYVDEFQTNDFIFKYRYNSTLNNYRIYLQDVNNFNSKARKTLEKMYVDDMYNSHQSELKDLIKIKKNYSKSYIESIEDLFGNKLSKDEVYRILFGVEFSLTDYHKLPLSKFKNDILKDLDII